MRRLELLIVVAVLAVPTAIGVGVLLHPLAAAGVVVLAVGAAGLGWVLTARQWLAWGYAEREADLLVRHGVLVRRLSIVPYGRMQFVDVTAGPVERWLKLATVHMHTAAAASDARIPGLGVVEATRLRDRLAALGEARAAGL
jgi:membrane protein YdbS with pleckstrin-like domain